MALRIPAARATKKVPKAAAAKKPAKKAVKKAVRKAVKKLKGPAFPAPEGAGPGH